MAKRQQLYRATGAGAYPACEEKILKRLRRGVDVPLEERKLVEFDAGDVIDGARLHPLVIKSLIRNGLVEPLSGSGAAPGSAAEGEAGESAESPATPAEDADAAAGAPEAVESDAGAEDASPGPSSEEGE